MRVPQLPIIPRERVDGHAEKSGIMAVDSELTACSPSTWQSVASPSDLESRQTEAARTARREKMTISCKHLSAIRDVVPSALGCEECLKLGDPWLHLRVCRSCGHVGCCDQSPNRHATKHFHATKHPIIEAYDPPEGWGWCYVDEVMFDLSGRPTPHLGPIPRFY